jgi:hypothetical protein
MNKHNSPKSKTIKVNANPANKQNRLSKAVLNFGTQIMDSVASKVLNSLPKPSPTYRETVEKRKGQMLRDDDYLEFLKFIHKKSKAKDKDNKTNHINEKIEFNLEDKTPKFMDKIIRYVAQDPQRNQYSKSSITIGIDDIKNEENLLNKISKLEKNFVGLSLTSPREQNQNYELIERHYLESLRQDNYNLQQQVNSLESQISEFKLSLHKVEGEKNFVKQVKESQNKQSNDNTKKLNKLNDDIIEAKKWTEKYRDTYTREKLEKDNLYRALINYTNQFDQNLSDELQEIYKIYNNQFFLAKLKPTDEGIVEDYLAKIQILEQEITKKNFELNNINKVLPADKRKIDLDLKTNSKVLPDLNTKKISDKKVEKKESFAVNVSNMARTSNGFRKSNHTSK